MWAKCNQIISDIGVEFEPMTSCLLMITVVVVVIVVMITAKVAAAAVIMINVFILYLSQINTGKQYFPRGWISLIFDNLFNLKHASQLYVILDFFSVIVIMIITKIVILLLS